MYHGVLRSNLVSVGAAALGAVSANVGCTYVKQCRGAVTCSRCCAVERPCQQAACQSHDHSPLPFTATIQQRSGHQQALKQAAAAMCAHCRLPPPPTHTRMQNAHNVLVASSPVAPYGLVAKVADLGLARVLGQATHGTTRTVSGRGLVLIRSVRRSHETQCAAVCGAVGLQTKLVEAPSPVEPAVLLNK